MDTAHPSEIFYRIAGASDEPDPNPVVQSDMGIVTIITQSAYLRTQLPGRTTEVADAIMSIAERTNTGVLNLVHAFMQLPDYGGLDLLSLITLFGEMEDCDTISEACHRGPSIQEDFREISTPCDDQAYDMAPDVTQEQGFLVCTSRTACLRTQIPEAWDEFDIMRISSRLHADGAQLCIRILLTQNQGGMPFDLVAEYLHKHYEYWHADEYSGETDIENQDQSSESGSEGDREISQVLSRMEFLGRLLNDNVDDDDIEDDDDDFENNGLQKPAILIPVTSVDSDHTCALCQHSQMEEEEPDPLWSTAKGCAAHTFHTTCLQKWTGGFCPLCRCKYLH